MQRLTPIVAALVAVAAVVAANVLLLGYGVVRNDPVGKLSPRVQLTPAPVPPTVIAYKDD